MNLTNFTLNATQQAFNINTMCPDVVNVNKMWYTAFVIMIGTTFFICCGLWVILMYLYQRERAEKIELIKTLNHEEYKGRIKKYKW